MNPTTLVGLFLAGWIAQQPPAGPATQTQTPPPAQEKPIAANLKVRIATSSYLTDGRVITASASDWPLALNKTVTAYATSGKTLCESRAATADRPTDVAAGWVVEFTPVREGASELEVRVTWRPLNPISRLQQSLNERVATRDQSLNHPVVRRATAAGPSTTLTLHPGDRVIVDYMGGGTSSGLIGWLFERPKTAKTGDVWLLRSQLDATSSGCNAVGMSLEIGLEPAKTEAVVQAELWLVRPNPDGTERSERQVLRLPLGQPASSYYFDEAKLAGTLPKDLSQALAKVSGELSAASVGTDGKIHLNLRLARQYEPAPRGQESASKVETTYRDLLATPGEVLAFQLPTMTPLPQLSVRLRTQLVK